MDKLENSSIVFYDGEIWKRNWVTSHLDLGLRKTRAGKSRDYRDVIFLERFRFQNVFRSHENEEPFLWFEERFRIKSSVFAIV